MKIYLDSSALVKRAVLEAESASLIAEVRRQSTEGHELQTSSLALVEVSRAIRFRREGDPLEWQELIATALSGVWEAEVDEQVITLARRIGPTLLRSLDAIHLATALAVGSDLFVTYDERLARVAEEMGLPTLAPA